METACRARSCISGRPEHKARRQLRCLAPRFSVLLGNF
jgi:hypothetical protein